MGVSLPTPIEAPSHRVRITGDGDPASTAIYVDGIEQHDVIRFEVIQTAEEIPLLALYRLLPHSFEIDQAMEITEHLADEARRNLHSAVVNSFGLRDDEIGSTLLYAVMEDAARYRALRAESERTDQMEFVVKSGAALDEIADEIRDALKRDGCWPLDPGGARAEEPDTSAPAVTENAAPDNAE